MIAHRAPGTQATRRWRRAVTTLALCALTAGAPPAHAVEEPAAPGPAEVAPSGATEPAGGVAAPTAATGEATPPAEGAPHAPADAPDASTAAAPSWLRAPARRGGATDDAPSGSTSLGWLFVPSIALGAVALWLALRRRSAADRALGGHRLAVLASTRVGPRAHAVVIDAGGRPLLLGVTDAGVSVLARLPRAAQAPAPAAASSERTPASTESASAFNRMLAELGVGSRAARRPANEDGAAAEIARTIRDEYVGRREAPEAVAEAAVEGQIAGLAARLAQRRA
ncbi:MAG: flagellar biosynthetic protein FliO [Polyangiaceae bacterium]|nr:flagellar biosynthetic protein FliO [Polyangiaceae bacterium]